MLCDEISNKDAYMNTYTRTEKPTLAFVCPQTLQTYDHILIFMYLVDEFTRYHNSVINGWLWIDLCFLRSLTLNDAKSEVLSVKCIIKVISIYIMGQVCQYQSDCRTFAVIRPVIVKTMLTYGTTGVPINVSAWATNIKPVIEP